jgi:predicted alpha/beta superfamily hydrolase
MTQIRAWSLSLIVFATISCARGITGPEGNPWRFLPGTVERFSFAPFRDGRLCWVYLPPGYATSGHRYPVLYVNDGEYAFDGADGRHLNRICEDLIRRGEMQPIIVVAISDGQRTIDYTPWPSGFFTTGEGGGDFYLLAIRDTLKPEIDRRYRTLTGPRNTAISGESLGGLISLYAGYAYGGTFGKVGALSPSYWWSNFHQYIDANPRPPEEIQLDTGFFWLNQAGSRYSLLNVATAYQQCLGARSTTPHAHLGVGLLSEGSAARSSISGSFGIGVGLRHVVGERHGAVRVEGRVDWLLRDTTTDRPPLTNPGLRLGFDLWL